MTGVTFRPRIAPYVVGAAFMTMVVYGVFLVIGTSNLPDYPFGLAALVGGGNLAWNLVTKARKHGIRVDASGITDVFSQVTLAWSEIATIKLEILQLHLQRPLKVNERGGKARSELASAGDTCAHSAGDTCARGRL